MNETSVLFCGCALARVIPEEVKQSVSDGLLRGGIAVDFVPDLCGLAARRDPWLKRFQNKKSVKIIACYPRAVRWLFHRAGVELAEEATLFNMREEEAPEILATLLSQREGGPGFFKEKKDDNNGWIPWFPVIDYDRCTGCLQCKKFCLFSVFTETEAGRPHVLNPKNCKTNCPACARICPEAAIIFPKHDSIPINGSDERPVQAGQSQVDLKTLLQGDLYEVLRSRGQDPKEQGDLMQAARALAEEERRKCACSGGLEDMKPEAAEVLKSICGCECECASEISAAPDKEACDPANGCCPEQEEKGPCCGE
jgi:Pyruvate/2-oxoacid:ferredoxin oxidoreductase delta subunit